MFSIRSNSSRNTSPLLTANSILENEINADETGAYKLYFETRALVIELSKQLADIYSDKNKWDSTIASNFLILSINKYEEELKAAKDKLQSIKSECTAKRIKDDLKKIEYAEAAITLLTKTISVYTDTLLERGIALSTAPLNKKEIEEEINLDKNKPSNKNNESQIFRAAANSFTLFLKILKEPQLASQFSPQELANLVRSHTGVGVDTNDSPSWCKPFMSGIVTLEIYKQVCNEIKNRLNNPVVVNNYEEMKKFVDFSRKNRLNTNPYDRPNLYNQSNGKVVDDLINTFSDKLEQPLYNAFENIYQALYDGQSGPFKRNFLTRLDPSESLEERIALIKDLSKKDPEGRVAKAWELAKKHYLNCTPSNTELFTEIHKEAFKRSWVFKRTKIVKGTVFFSSSNLNAKQQANFSGEQINAGQKDPDSRRAKIANALLGPR